MRGVALVFLKRSSRVTIGGSALSGSGGGGGRARSLAAGGLDTGAGGGGGRETGA